MGYRYTTTAEAAKMFLFLQVYYHTCQNYKLIKIYLILYKMQNRKCLKYAYDSWDIMINTSYS